MKNPAVQRSLIFWAVILTIFYGSMAYMTQFFGFDGTESTWVRTAFIIPRFFWIPALACLKFPRAGLIGLVVMEGVFVLLWLDPLHRSIGLLDVPLGILGALGHSWLVLLSIAFLVKNLRIELQV